MKKNPTTSDATNQRDRFIETARDLECDEDEGRFNETLKRIVPKKDGLPVSETGHSSEKKRC